MKPFRYYFSIIPALIVSAFTLYGQSTEPSTMMWSVEDDDSKVYLLGSIHLADSTLYPLQNVIEQSYNKSDHLVVELNMLNINATELMQLAMIQDTTELKDYVSEEHYKMFQNAFTAVGIPESMYSRFKPWMATMTLMQHKMSEIGIEAQYGIDMHFLQKANASGKEILELETLKSQADTFEKLSNISDEYVDYTLETVSVSEEDILMMIDAWKEGDIEAYEEYLLKDKDREFYEEVMEIMLYGRNKKMAQKIKSYLDEGGTYFIIVGAAHLIGEKSIQDYLLQMDNYKIKRY